MSERIKYVIFSNVISCSSSGLTSSGGVSIIEKLEFISDAKSVGFTIKEIGQIIDAWYNKKYTKKQKLEILDEKLISLEQKMKEIKEMKKQILQFKDDVLNNKC